MKDIIFGRWETTLHSAQNNQKIYSPQSESKIFVQFKFLPSTTPLESNLSKDLVKNKYTSPHKNLKITITYKLRIEWKIDMVYLGKG